MGWQILAYFIPRFWLLKLPAAPLNDVYNFLSKNSLLRNFLQNIFIIDMITEANKKITAKISITFTPSIHAEMKIIQYKYIYIEINNLHILK
jgi:predicted secreted protein